MNPILQVWTPESWQTTSTAGDQSLPRSRSKWREGKVRFRLLYTLSTLMTNFCFQKRRTGVKTGAGARRVTERAAEAEAGSEAAEAGEDLGDVG